MLVEVKNITIKLSSQEIVLSLEEVKELKKVLDSLLGTQLSNIWTSWTPGYFESIQKDCVLTTTTTT